jgi:hypothetical protein
MIKYYKLINNMLYMCVCAYVETFSTAFTSLPFVMYVFHVIFIYDY